MAEEIIMEAFDRGPSRPGSCRHDRQIAHADAFEDILKKGVVRIATPLDVPPMARRTRSARPRASTSNWPAWSLRRSA